MSQRLRWSRMCTLAHTFQYPPATCDSLLCEFAAVNCRRKSRGETPCCARPRGELHLAPHFVCNCPIAQTSRKSRSVVQEICPKTLVMKCQMSTKPPKPRCQVCKLNLVTCEKHMGICSRPAFTACPFCLRFNCNTGECAEKICCDAAAKRIEKPPSANSKPKAVARGPAMPIVNTMLR